MSSPFWWLIGHAEGGYWSITGLMWCPAIAAIATKLAFRDRVRELGLSLPSPRSFLGIAYALPFLYATPIYAVVWLLEHAALQDSHLAKVAIARFPDLPLPQAAGCFVLLMLSLGFLDKATRALGEEIGWRGFLVPELAKVKSLTGVGWISGLMWALWHYPLIIFGGYHSQAPLWYGLLCFTVMVVAWAYIAAWLRLRTRSAWPAVVLHASHNALLQLVLNPLTVSSVAAVYLIDEFGAGVALGTLCVAAFLCTREAHQVRHAQRVA